MSTFRRLVSVVTLLTLGLVARAANVPPLMYGAAWYPEQWSEATWEADLARMQAAGLNMVRIGEFAWSSLEPSESNYQLDWMERAVAAAARHGMVTIIGTPTDTPPAWLTTKYPEVLRVSEDGKQLQHGSRRHFSIASAKYRELCARIVTQLAQRFGQNPNVVAWQIGNEFTEDSFDDESKRGWHVWLEQRYGSLDQLNRHWMTAYWSQTYSQWNQIPMTTGRANPGLLLDYKRYVTDTWLAFQRNQIAVLRAHVEPRQLITTNLGGVGWANRFNRQLIAADYDVISWDEYLGAGYADNSRNGTGHLDPDRSGSTHDLVRGWKQRNFWVLEMPPGFVDWSSVSNSLDRGETRAMAWHSVAHGADCVAYWQWRSALNGQEQYHGSLVGPDGEPVPVYAEAAQAGREFAQAAPVIAGTSPVAEVALIHDYDSRWAIDFNRFSNRYEQLEVLHSYYKALRQQTQSVDIVTPAMDLARYKLIVAPSLNVVSTELAAKLTAWVEAGGHLVLGPRTGMKNEFNALNTQRQPGPLVAPLGGRVEQFYALLEDVPVTGEWGSGRATVWAETLAPLTAAQLSAFSPQRSASAGEIEVPLRYGPGNDWLAGQPAALRRPVGKGTITYLGAVVDQPLMQALAKQWTALAKVDAPVIGVPERVSVGRRVAADREVYILTNFSAGPQDIALPAPMTDVLNGGEVTKLNLPRYGVAVLCRRIVALPSR
ncbi:MAG: beta-galactosidase [Opitutae bacterium]|nr:beta-galactosidase [Opitutae bacterium]